MSSSQTAPTKFQTLYRLINDLHEKTIVENHLLCEFSQEDLSRLIFLLHDSEKLKPLGKTTRDSLTEINTVVTACVEKRITLTHGSETVEKGCDSLNFSEGQTEAMIEFLTINNEETLLKKVASSPIPIEKLDLIFEEFKRSVETQDLLTVARGLDLQGNILLSRLTLNPWNKKIFSRVLSLFYPEEHTKDLNLYSKDNLIACPLIFRLLYQQQHTKAKMLFDRGISLDFTFPILGYTCLHALCAPLIQRAELNDQEAQKDMLKKLIRNPDRIQTSQWIEEGNPYSDSYADPKRIPHSPSTSLFFFSRNLLGKLRLGLETQEQMIKIAQENDSIRAKKALSPEQITQLFILYLNEKELNSELMIIQSPSNLIIHAISRGIIPPNSEHLRLLSMPGLDLSISEYALKNDPAFFEKLLKFGCYYPNQKCIEAGYDAHFLFKEIKPGEMTPFTRERSELTQFLGHWKSLGNFENYFFVKNLSHFGKYLLIKEQNRLNEMPKNPESWKYYLPEPKEDLTSFALKLPHISMDFAKCLFDFEWQLHQSFDNFSCSPFSFSEKMTNILCDSKVFENFFFYFNSDSTLDLFAENPIQGGFPLEPFYEAASLVAKDFDLSLTDFLAQLKNIDFFMAFCKFLFVKLESLKEPLPHGKLCLSEEENLFYRPSKDIIDTFYKSLGFLLIKVKQFLKESQLILEDLLNPPHYKPPLTEEQIIKEEVRKEKMELVFGINMQLEYLRIAREKNPNPMSKISFRKAPKNIPTPYTDIPNLTDLWELIHHQDTTPELLKEHFTNLKKLELKKPSPSLFEKGSSELPLPKTLLSSFIETLEKKILDSEAQQALLESLEETDSPQKEKKSKVKKNRSKKKKEKRATTPPPIKAKAPSPTKAEPIKREEIHSAFFSLPRNQSFDSEEDLSKIPSAEESKSFTPSPEPSPGTSVSITPLKSPTLLADYFAHPKRSTPHRAKMPDWWIPSYESRYQKAKDALFSFFSVLLDFHERLWVKGSVLDFETSAPKGDIDFVFYLPGPFSLNPDQIEALKTKLGGTAYNSKYFSFEGSIETGKTFDLLFSPESENVTEKIKQDFEAEPICHKAQRFNPHTAEHRKGNNKQNFCLSSAHPLYQSYREGETIPSPPKAERIAYILKNLALTTRSLDKSFQKIFTKFKAYCVLGNETTPPQYYARHFIALSMALEKYPTHTEALWKLYQQHRLIEKLFDLPSHNEPGLTAFEPLRKPENESIQNSFVWACLMYKGKIAPANLAKIMRENEMLITNPKSKAVLNCLSEELSQE